MLYESTAMSDFAFEYEAFLLSPTECFWLATFTAMSSNAMAMPIYQRAIQKIVSRRKWIANISLQHPPMRFCPRRRVQFCDERAVFKLAR